MQPSEEIKAKLDIVDVIRDYIPLKAAGMNFRGKCPFHQEKSPSFMVSPDKQIYHCFGCGKGGDMFSFVMGIENVDFVEAMRILAPKAGVTLAKQDAKSSSERNRVLDAIELARKFYHKYLMDSPAAEAARAYLKKRGLSEETIEEWQIGLSPDSWESLSNLLKQKGFKENEIFLAGLSSKAQNSSRYYDRFRGRIMFPINDANGNTVAFTARVSPEKEATEQMGKYINSPQSQVYDKGKLLFGLDKAKHEIKKSDSVVIVEGQMDVISAHQAGFKNVVASSGTALTIEQINILKRYTGNFLFALDSDSAGQEAIGRGEEIASDMDLVEIEALDPYGRMKRYIDPQMSYNINRKVVIIPEGKDPDDCIRNNPDSWRQAVETAMPMMDFFFEKILGRLNLDKIEHRQEAAKKLLPIIGRLENKIEQGYWLRVLSEKIEAKEDILREALTNYLNRVKKSVPMKESPRLNVVKDRPLSKGEILSESLLAMAFKHPVLIEYLAGALQIEELVGQNPKNLYRNLVFYYNNSNSEEKSDLKQSIDYSHFKEWLILETKGKIDQSRDQLKLLEKLVFLAERDYYDQEFNQIKQEMDNNIIYLKRDYIKTRMKEIEEMISASEKGEKQENGEDYNVTELLEQFRHLSNELKGLPA